MGIGDWGLGIGPIPNPQSPIPNPHDVIKFYKKLFIDLFLFIFNYYPSYFLIKYIKIKKIMDIELKESSNIVKNLSGEEFSKQRSQRKIKNHQNTYRNFLEFEEAIFGDILQEDEDNMSEMLIQNNKKPKSAIKNRNKNKFMVHKDIPGDMRVNITNPNNLNDDKQEQEQTKVKIPRKKKTKFNPDEDLGNIREDFDTVVNLSELANKTTGYTNSEMILIILEICLNSINYEIILPNATRKFWDTVYEKEEWENFLYAYRPETLRKYWRILRDANNIKKVIDTTNTYAMDLDYPGVK